LPEYILPTDLFSNISKNPKIDLDKVKAYIEVLPTPENRQFTLFILSTTQYVPWSVFIDKLNASCDAFSKNIGNTSFYVYRSVNLDQRLFYSSIMAKKLDL